MDGQIRIQPLNDDSIGAQLVTFMRNNGGRPHCDECLLEEIPGAHIDDVSYASAVLRRGSNFSLSEISACTRCGNVKPLTMGAA
jgi:hypothetical protein